MVSTFIQAFSKCILSTMCQVLDVVLDTENIVVSYTVFAAALKADSPLNSTASFFFFKTFLRAVKVYNNIEREGQRFPISLSPDLCMHSFPHYQYRSLGWCIRMSLH